MQRLQEINIHIQFRVNSISFVGNLFTADGLQVDPEKVKAIREIPTPTCKQDVKGFLGMTNYLARYIEHHSDKTRALRSLTHIEWRARNCDCCGRMDLLRSLVNLFLSSSRSELHSQKVA